MNNRLQSTEPMGDGSEVAMWYTWFLNGEGDGPFTLEQAKGIADKAASNGRTVRILRTHYLVSERKWTTGEGMG